MKFRSLFYLSCTAFALVTVVYTTLLNHSVGAVSEQPPLANVDTSHERTKVVTIEPGMTFGGILEDQGIPTATRVAIQDAVGDVYDVSTIKAGKDMTFFFDQQTDALVRIMYPISTEEELYIEYHAVGSNASKDVWNVVDGMAHGWSAHRVPIAYEVRTRFVQGTILSSLYAAGKELGLDDRAIIALADVFQWQVDFAWSVQSGDAFAFVFEERYRDGAYVMPGKVLAAQFVNNESEYRAYYFDTVENGEGNYFDPEGNSLKKIFLKAPVEYRYISSGYTTGMRYVQAFDTATRHRAIDYAAGLGTPVQSVGDGMVVSAGWNGPYGNFVSIRHNSTYTTNYAHLSKILVTKGEYVSQGEVIGKVGSTGFSTGPHLHYEMVKNGEKINPLKESFPSGEPIAEKDMQRFLETMESFETYF